MTQAQNRDYRQVLDEFLSNYEDGYRVLTANKDWEQPVRLKPGAEDKDENLPTDWMAVAERILDIVAKGKYGLDTYTNEIEVISPDWMLEAYAKVGMPVSYDHWSFGMELKKLQKNYKAGRMGLAYEIVINADPAIAYCMEDNTAAMQLLVIAHASFGHNSFFKGNHLFRQFTKADEILPDLRYLKSYISQCEETHGWQEVEKLLDACHALQTHGVDRYTKPPRRTPQEDAARRARLAESYERNYDDVLARTTGFSKPSDAMNEAAKRTKPVPESPEENLMMFIASYAPHLEEWQRQIIRMIAEKSQYFYPQRQTQVMNEGWASFWHYTLLHDLSDLGIADPGIMLEVLDSHSGVLYQPDFDQKWFNGLNPYALGFAIYRDIKRMCEEPTEEDRRWFPDIAGNPDWVGVLTDAMRNFKDESFILQFLSPKVMRDFSFFAIEDDDKKDEIEVTAIHDDEGYRRIRRDLSKQYNLGNREPMIEVVDYDYAASRSLTLRHTIFDNKPLHEGDANEVLKYILQLWGHPVILNSVDEDGKIQKTFSCGQPKSDTKPTPRP